MERENLSELGLGHETDRFVRRMKDLIWWVCTREWKGTSRVIHFMGITAAQNVVEMDEKATDILHGLPLESGPTPALPEKKLLVSILDRLQKKDTYGVFSEPVDPNELPDYHKIIEHPMDFGTVRKKLDKGRYSYLEEFEADVFLICSNAMQYNSPNTIYFRQARSIQELAKRDFENLRQVNDDGVPQPRIVKRGRPPGKNLKKLLGNPPFDRVAPESTSDATLATVGDNATGSNSYNLRKPPTVSLRVRSNDEFLAASHLSRNYESYSEWLSELNSEFPATDGTKKEENADQKKERGEPGNSLSLSLSRLQPPMQPRRRVLEFGSTTASR